MNHIEIKFHYLIYSLGGKAFKKSKNGTILEVTGNSKFKNIYK